MELPPRLDWTPKRGQETGLKRWARAQPQYQDQHHYLYVEDTAERLNRCQIGPLALRYGRLEEKMSRSMSYFLAEVAGGKVRVCRAAGFIYHRPPGVAKDVEEYKDYIIFVLPEWLYSAYPLMTIKSQLPVVVMPDEPAGTFFNSKRQTRRMTMPAPVYCREYGLFRAFAPLQYVFSC